MTTDWDDQGEVGGEDDPGFLGGGGPPSTMGDDADPELDEHGDNLSRVEEDLGGDDDV